MKAITLTETCLRTRPKFGLIYAQSKSREKEEVKEPHLKNERKDHMVALSKRLKRGSLSLSKSIIILTIYLDINYIYVLSYIVLVNIPHFCNPK